MPCHRSEIIHATALSIGGNGVLICGASGSGKSDLALRCLSVSAGKLLTAPFELVSDDRTDMWLEDGAVMMTAPSTIAGKLEVRGVGIIDVPYAKTARLCMVVQLTDREVERYPELSPAYQDILGKRFDLLCMRPFEASAPMKLAMALQVRAGAKEL
ncbi:MAG: HPr kinase/phosphatase C-terminal domain-containing protein [Pseudomonadota bacterium]